MSLQRLDIYNVRNICKQTIQPSAKFNFIYGKNGSGKSALIEAIFVLGRAKSFRTTSIRQVINFDQPELIISSELCSNSHSMHLGIRMDGTDVDIHQNHQAPLKRAELAYSLPLQIIHPKSFELLDAGAQIRREFLDWGVFNQENSFLSAWKNYKKSLAQRNALLKSKNTQQLTVWNKELIEFGSLVNEYRLAYIKKLEPVLKNSISFFLPFNEVSFSLVSGWDPLSSLEACLEEDLDRDLRDGFTHSGPHRGDFQLMLSDRLARDVVSRGQLKLLVVSLKLAQVELLYEEHGFFGCILIDDFSAELDKENRKKLLIYLKKLDCQAFITTTEKNDFGDLSIITDYKMFHVEHGEIHPEDVPRET